MLREVMQKREHDQAFHRSLLANERNALLEAVVHRFLGALRHEARGMIKSEMIGSEERKCVQPEAPLLAQFRQR